MTFIRGGRADHNRPGPGVSPPKPSLIIRSSDNLRHNGVTGFLSVRGQGTNQRRIALSVFK
jgi:hypothetical protein